ncbi:MAG: type II toxin-antitoxin system HicA family toxin [Euryarchaeota archaeon]
MKFLESIGFRVTRTRGSHVRLVSKDGRATTIPIHAHRQLPAGLLHAVAREVQISWTDFFKVWSCYGKV